MADETVVPSPAPPGESQPQPIPIPHESALETPADATPAQTSFAEKLTAAVGGVAEKYGLTFKPGRGRPKKDGTPKISDLLVSADGTATPAVGQPALVAAVATPDSLGDALLHRTIVRAARGIIGAAGTVLKRLALKAGLDRAFVEGAVASAEPEAEALADFSESLDAVLKKYQVRTEYAPEVSLALSTVRLAAPFWLTYRMLKDEIERKRTQESKETKP